MSLVTCAKQGNSLTTWLNNATQEEKDLLCEALDCGGGGAALVDCAGAPLEEGDAVPSCEEFSALVQTVSEQAQAITALTQALSDFRAEFKDCENEPLFP